MGSAQARQNLALHGVDFVRAALAFADPNRMMSRDERRDYGEMRVNMLARAGEHLLHVTVTMRGSVTRIISARRASRREKNRYEHL